MILLIDAYNVLKQSSSSQYINDAQRTAFIKKLLRYSDVKGHTIIVVFDGGDGPRPTDRKCGLIRVIYSGYRSNADEILKQLCSQFKRFQTVLVSSDREICSFAYTHGIVCIGALALNDLLEGLRGKESGMLFAKAQGEITKRKGCESSLEVDQLMRESTQSLMVKEEDSRQENRNAPSKKASRAEKKLKKLVNKL